MSLVIVNDNDNKCHMLISRFGGIFSSLKLGKTWLKGYLEYAHFKFLVSQRSVNLSCIRILIANVYSVNMLN